VARTSCLALFVALILEPKVLVLVLVGPHVLDTRLCLHHMHGTHFAAKHLS